MSKLATNNLRMIKDMQVSLVYFKSQMNSKIHSYNNRSSVVSFIDDRSSEFNPCKGGDYINNYSIYAMENKHHRIIVENSSIKDELASFYS